MPSDRELFYKSFYGQENLTNEELKQLNNSEFRVLNELYNRHHFKFDKEIQALLKNTDVKHKVTQHELHEFYMGLLHAVEDRIGLAEFSYNHENHKKANVKDILLFIEAYVSNHLKVSEHQKCDLIEYLKKRSHCHVGELMHLLIFLAMEARV
jgi:hypothetical protein